MLSGQVALVTGASRGVGRGIALQLGEAGATVYITGRQPRNSDAKNDPNLPTLEKTASEITQRGGRGIAVYCDHSDSNDIKQLFDRIEKEQNGQLDILINNAYSAVNLVTDSWGKKFYEMEPSVWDDVNNVGLRNHYICSVYAARLMVPRKKGLIVVVSSPGGLRYFLNVAYGVGKAACDRLAADIAVELKSHDITAISLWPGAVRTELVTSKLDKTSPNAQMFEEGETIEYSGRAIVHLAADKNRLNKTGKVVVTSDLGDEYGFMDIDGRHPPNIRAVTTLLKRAGWQRTSSLIPAWIKVPGWFISASTSKF